MDRESWRFINTFAPWLSALGTITAVVVSLWLARRQGIRLRASVGVFKELVGPNPGSRSVLASVTNCGVRPVRISNIYWQPFPWSRGGYITARGLGAALRNASIDEGDTANHEVPYSEPELADNFAPVLRRKRSGRFGRLELFTLRLVFVTTAGPKVKARPNKELLDALRGLSAPGHQRPSNSA